MKRVTWMAGAVLLAVALQANAALMDAGALVVGASDVVTDQTDGTRSGYDFRWRYDVINDKYSMNASTDAAITGYVTGTFSKAGTTRTQGSKNFINSTSQGMGTIVWKFDFSQAGATANAIDQLQVKATSYAFKGGTGGSVAWAVSTDNVNWTTFIELISSTTTDMADGAYHDLTSVVQGASVYYLRVQMDPWANGTDYSNAQIFRARTTDPDLYNFDNQVWLVPEPMTMGLLIAGGIAGVLRRHMA